MIASKTLIFSNYYRYNAFYEDSLKRLLDAGFQVVVLSNVVKGGDRFGQLKIAHPNFTFINGVETSYDGGMTYLHNKKILQQYNKEYLLHLDNDCFLSGVDELKHFCEGVISQDYDYSCHVVQEEVRNRYVFDQYGLSLITDPKIVPAKAGEIDTPNPHFETSYLMIKTKVWDQLTDEDVSHGRKLVCSLYRNNSKVAAHYAFYKWNYSSWGKEWFHIGYIMEKCSKILSNEAYSYNPNSEFDRFRVGFFLAHTKIYPEKFDSFIKRRITDLVNHMGGERSVMECWESISKGTCLENWRRYE